MDLYRFVSIAAVASYFIPLIIVLGKKAWRDKFFLLFAIYWSLGGVVNLFDVLPGITKETINVVGIAYNMLDIPFILGILYYTSVYSFIRKTVSGAFAVVSVIQVLSIVNAGLTYDALKYSLGIGVLMVLCIVIMEIVRYMQKVEHSTRQNAKMFVYAAVLFEYATFVVIYIFDYIVTTDDKTDSYIIYYVSTLVAITIASCGFVMYRKYEHSPVYLNRK